MGFETPSTEQPKSESELLREEILKTGDELAAMESDAPEYGFLKEKLIGYNARLAELEDESIEDLTGAVKPELRTPESYGIQKEKNPDIEREHKNLDTMIENIREQEKKRKAS